MQIRLMNPVFPAAETPGMMQTWMGFHPDFSFSFFLSFFAFPEFRKLYQPFVGAHIAT